MNDRIMVKVTATENCLYFRTIAWDRKSPREFCIPKTSILRLRRERYLVVNDIYCFAEIHREPDASVSIEFTWMKKDLYTGNVEGWSQIISLPLGPLLIFAERGGLEDNPKKWVVLSRKATFSPRIVFVNTENLRKAVENLTVRHKLAKFLSQNFHYRYATEIRLYNDYFPYSFFFREMIGDMVGMCGGVILHGQDNLKKSEYSIHT